MVNDAKEDLIKHFMRVDLEELLQMFHTSFLFFSFVQKY